MEPLEECTLPIVNSLPPLVDLSALTVDLGAYHEGLGLRPDRSPPRSALFYANILPK
jgi:hypothetical protein